MLQLILLVFAFVIACIAAWPSSEPHRLRLIAGALAFFFLACIFGHQVIANRINPMPPTQQR